MAKFSIGYDVYEMDCINISYYIDLFIKNKIQIYHLRKIDTYTYRFLTRRKDTYTLNKLDIPVQYTHSVGPLYYLTLFFKSKLKIFGMIIFICVFFYTKQHILNLKIVGTQYQLNEQIVAKLSDYHINFFDKLLTLDEITDLKNKLLNDFKSNIDWINVYQKGETIFIEYTNKKESEIAEVDARPIVACKESVIKEFQIQSGYIVTSINQYVEPGTLLVSNAIVSTFEETVLVNPKGKVYGYTWYDIEKELPLNDEADDFNQLLLQIRLELQKQLGEDAKIDKEKVLQYSVDNSKIKLKVHYTVIEDIACKGEMNEQSTETN